MNTDDSNPFKQEGRLAPLVMPCRVIGEIWDDDAFEQALETEGANTRRRAALERACRRGPRRDLVLATHEKIAQLATLANSHPNFSELLASLKRDVALARLSDPPTLRWPPILLDGPPGVGKTHFARALAKALGTEFFEVTCSTVSAGFVLAGSSASWAESRPGKVFDALCSGAYANPIILLDEIDKLAGDPRFDGFGPLYGLLEDESARHFVDEHVGVPVDASNILWLGTSNDLRPIPEPILSRFRIVRVPPPSEEQSMAVLKSVYRELLRESPGWSRWFSRVLSPEVVNLLATLPPRDMKRALLAGLGSAALRHRRQEQLSLRPSDFECWRRPAKPPVGFVS